MKFCPLCSNILVIGTTSMNYRFYCNTCSYFYPVTKKIVTTHVFETKQVDDVLGGKEAWENVDQTAEICPKCNHNKAYYRQIQIRSADEPMTVFFKCCDCHHQWSQN